MPVHTVSHITKGRFYFQTPEILKKSHYLLCALFFFNTIPYNHIHYFPSKSLNYSLKTTFLSWKKKKKKNTTQNNRLNVQHCCSSAFAFMNESAVCMHTGFPAARSARSAEKETFEAILCSDGGNGKAGLLLRT